MADKANNKRQDIKTLCSEIAQRHGQSHENLTLGLELLAIETLAHDPDLSDFILQGNNSGKQLFTDWHTGGANDGTMDGLLYSEDLSHVFVIQTKYKKDKVNEATFAEARDFFSKVNDWANVKKRNTFNEETQRLLDECQFDPKQQLIDLYFITTQSADNSEYESVAESQTNLYQEAGLNVICHFLAFSDFSQLVADSKASRADLMVKEITMMIPKNNQFVFDGEGGMRVLVLTIKAQEIASIYNRKDVRNNLFNANVRAALSTGRVNPVVADTAEDEENSKYFYYYNNGITATCSNFELNEQKTSVKLTNLQVVNGAQTVAALSKGLRRNPNSKAHVLLRIIETNENYKNKNNIADSITRYQNTQNPVKASDFFSNEPFQKWISELIDKHSGNGSFPPVWYEYKRGIKAGSKANRKKLTMEELAYLRYACLWDAPFTYKYQRDIWNGENNNLNYWKAFGSNGEEIQVWSKEEIQETLWMIKSWLMLKNRATALNAEFRKVKDAEKGSKNIERTYLGVMARYITALAFNLMKELRDRGDLISTFADLESQSQEIRDLETKVFRVVRRAVKDSFQNEWTDVANPRLNMPQNADTWASLKKKVISDFDFDDELDF